LLRPRRARLSSEPGGGTSGFGAHRWPSDRNMTDPWHTRAMRRLVVCAVLSGALGGCAVVESGEPIHVPSPPVVVCAWRSAAEDPEGSSPAAWFLSHLVPRSSARASTPTRAMRRPPVPGATRART
jgi:hypothetical protein